MSMPHLIGAMLLISTAECLLTSTIPKSAIIRSASSLQFSYDNAESTELLQALLHEADTTIKPYNNRSRQREYSYQRRRLGEQLRLTKKSSYSTALNLQKRDEEELFQRRRLAEQLKFDQQKGGTKRKAAVVTTHYEHDLEESNLKQNYSEQPNELHWQLQKLNELVDVAIYPPAPSSNSSLVIYKETDKEEVVTSNNTASLFEIMSNTHLPMPPKEDASITSLFLAPLAHLITSIYLFGAAVFYAIMAALDTLWNDDKIKPCLKQTGHVMKSCLRHVSNSSSTKQILSGIVDSGKCCFVASWYMAKCIVLRAKYSRYANECLDTGTSSLRYGVYMVRSINVLWQRLVGGIRGNNYQKNKTTSVVKPVSKSPRRKFHLSHLLSSLQNSQARLLYKRQQIQLDQQRARLEHEYQEKLSRLNRDRIVIERERIALEEDRTELLCESMNLLAWCSSAVGSTGPPAAKEVESKKGWSSWWKAWD
eukprot:scaffold43183_cov66-Cyclotella_meneghiniana.AAC.3